MFKHSLLALLLPFAGLSLAQTEATLVKPRCRSVAIAASKPAPRIHLQCGNTCWLYSSVAALESTYGPLSDKYTLAFALLQLKDIYIDASASIGDFVSLQNNHSLLPLSAEGKNTLSRDEIIEQVLKLRQKHFRPQSTDEELYFQAVGGKLYASKLDWLSKINLGPAAESPRLLSPSKITMIFSAPEEATELLSLKSDILELDTVKVQENRYFFIVDSKHMLRVFESKDNAKPQEIIAIDNLNPNTVEVEKFIAKMNAIGMEIVANENGASMSHNGRRIKLQETSYWPLIAVDQDGKAHLDVANIKSSYEAARVELEKRVLSGMDLNQLFTPDVEFKLAKSSPSNEKEYLSYLQSIDSETQDGTRFIFRIRANAQYLPSGEIKTLEGASNESANTHNAGHFLLLDRIDFKNSELIFQNSEGIEAGQKGFFKMTFEDFKRLGDKGAKVIKK